jgi:hypothetical protein
LAQQGFDVWIANTRTTRFGYGHAKYTRKDEVSSALLHLPSFLRFADYLFFPMKVLNAKGTVFMALKVSILLANYLFPHKLWHSEAWLLCFSFPF